VSAGPARGVAAAPGLRHHLGVERLELTTFRRRTATAFKILGPISLLLGACRAGGEAPSAKPEPTKAAPTASASAAATVGKYGAPLGSAPPEALASVLATPDRFAGRPVTVEGHVRRACTAMGCWMELAESGDEAAPGCRVIMKDHSFFVPTDSAGASARVEGTLSVRRIEPGQVAHMEGEGAKFDHKAADGSAEELRFVASGVELWRG
jgi:hypothetical protein